MKPLASRVLYAAAVGLALVLAVAAWAYTGSSKSAGKSMHPSGVGESFDCTDLPQWKVEDDYANGDRAQNRDAAYECKESGWCSQGLDVFEPGTTIDGGAWDLAWTMLGTCGPVEPVFEGNQITIRFPAAPARAKPHETLTGSLRCATDTGHRIPVSGTWGETVRIDELKQCNYHLVMDSASTQSPLNTPAIVPLSQEQGENKNFDVAYGPTIDLTSLSTLPGVKVELFKSGLLQPRQMAMGNGVLYVGSSAIPSRSHEGRVADFIYALPLDDAGLPRDVYIVQSGLVEPHGVAYRDGALYYSTTGGLYKIDDIDNTYTDAHPVRVLKFPADDSRFPLPEASQPVGVASRMWHQKHPLFFNPLDKTDKHLYTAIGNPCNLCMVPRNKDDRYGTVLQYDLEKGTAVALATGVRNSVGLAWNPDTGELWFSDNNRQPFTDPNYVNPDEINRIQKGTTRKHYGFPYFFGNDTPGFTEEEYEDVRKANGAVLAPGLLGPDEALGESDPDDHVKPALELPNASAPLGIAYWSGYPEEAGTRNMLVAVHGGGTQDSPGNVVRLLRIKGSNVVQNLPFIQGWTPTNGSPVEFLPLQDGSILISDDISGSIYRVSYDPAAVVDTEVSLQLPSVAPAPELANKRIRGVLAGDDGIQRVFDTDWSGVPIKFPGLQAGKYKVTMSDVGGYVPKPRAKEFDLVTGVPQSIAITYDVRPEINVELTVKAPPKPAGVASTTWQVSFRSLLSGGNAPPAPIEIDWGQSKTVNLKYGQYEVIFPYFKDQIPTPSLAKVFAQEDSDAQQKVEGKYVAGRIGETLVSGACNVCHAVAPLGTEERAEKFVDAPEALNLAIGGMNNNLSRVGEHCDGVCVGEIAEYLKTELWAPFLNPPASEGFRQLRRLTRPEYAASVKQVLGVTVNSGKLPVDEINKGYRFPGQASGGFIRKDAVYSYLGVAEEAAAAWAPTRTPVRADQFVADLGRRLFRRPLTPGELQPYEALMAGKEATAGQRLVVTSMLLSPHFLFREELGDAGADGLYQLNDYEIATALSFTFLGVTPSDALLDKAESGGLKTNEQILAVAREMITSKEGIARFTSFIRYYTGATPDLFPKPAVGFTQELADAMTTERELFVAEMLKSPDGGKIRDWYNPGFTMLNGPLAAHYEVPGVTGPEFKKVKVDSCANCTDKNGLIKHGGLLNQGAFHVAVSGPEATAMIKRGFVLRENVMGHEFGTPLATPDSPVFDKPATMRQRWEEINGRGADPSCWVCHQYVNDTGALLENFDAAGRWRETELAVNAASFPDLTPEELQVPLDATAKQLLDSASIKPIGDMENIRSLAMSIPYNKTAMGNLVESYMRWQNGERTDIYMQGIKNKVRGTMVQQDAAMLKMIESMLSDQSFRTRRDRNQVPGPFLPPLQHPQSPVYSER